MPAAFALAAKATPSALALAMLAFSFCLRSSPSRLDRNTSVVPASSLIACAYTCFAVKRTARRGRVAVPATFLRIRQRRFCSRRDLVTVLVLMGVLLRRRSCLPCGEHVRQ